MECPGCKNHRGVVVTHTSRILGSVRRRRQCLECRTVFYTWEIEENKLTVKTILKTMEELTSRLSSRKNKGAKASQ